MADETKNKEEEPKRPRRRRRRKADAEQAPEVTSDASQDEAVEADAASDEVEPPAADEVEATAEDEVEATAEDEVEPTPEEVEAEEKAADVVLEAEAEIDEDSEPEAAEPPAQAAPRRRRVERDPSLPPPVVRAQAKYVRSSARKARLVCDHIRGKSVEDARAILAHAPRAVASDWSKLLESAVANAEHNHELVGEDLYVKAIHADEGPTLKRYRPRALGRATRIRKRTSHLTILLTPKD
jgi:ribosomal protein L22